MIFNNPSWHRVTAALGANTAELVFAAATNVRGAWIINAMSYGRVASPGIPYSELTWGATAPTAINNRNTIKAVDTYNAGELAGTNTGRFWVLEPFFVPAGNGLWFFNVTAQAGTAVRACGYQLL